MEDSSQVPLIHQLINEAIQFLCQSADKGRDWSFLKTKAILDVVADPSATTVVVKLPSDFRSVIHVEEGEGYECELHGRDLIVKAASAAQMPTTLTVEYYRAHPLVCAVTQDGGYSTDGADAEWTPTNPPASQILLPDEAADAIVYETLMLLMMHEIEVAVNTQFAEKVVATTLEYMKSNYALQIDYRTPVTETEGVQSEVLTVGWLVNYGKVLAGGERDEYQLISLVNRVGSEFADALRLRGSQRPKIRNKLTDTLPTFGGVAGFSMSGTTTEKEIPAEYWMVGMRYQLFRSLKTLQDIDVAEYRETLEALKELFYSLQTGGVFDYSTYGGMMDYLRSIWKSQRNDLTLWAALNQTIADVMRAINVNELLACKKYNVTNEQMNDFDLPDDFKNCMKIMLDGKYEIIGRAFSSRGRTPSEQQLWSFPGDWKRPWRHCNYFSFVGKKIHFHHPLCPNHMFELWYYPKHVWPYVTVNGTKAFDLNAKIPVDVDLLCLALQARVALETKDYNGYKIHIAAYNDALAAFNEAQNRSLPEDSRFIAAVPPVDYIVACNTFGFGEF